MHQSSLSLFLSILLQKASYFPCCSWISSVFCYSFWRPYLNGNGLTLTIHSCLHIYQSTLSSIFHLSILFLYIKRASESLLPLYTQFQSFQKHHKNVFFLAFCYVFVSLSVPSSFTLHFTHLVSLTAQLSVWSSIHLQTPFPTWTVCFSLLLLNRSFLSIFLFFFLPFITNLFMVTSLCHLALYLPSSFLPPHPPPNHPSLIQNYPIWLEWLQQM